jgi:DNA-binding transcriptional MerR regulator
LASYSISELAKITGVKCHTIRIWEKRYNLFKPSRNALNCRSYSDEDLKLLKDVAKLKAAGVKISKIAAMNHGDICNCASSLTNEDESAYLWSSKLVDAIIELDESAVHNIINDSFRCIGFEKTLCKVFIPVQRRLDTLWISGVYKPLQKKWYQQVVIRRINQITSDLPTIENQKQIDFLLFPYLESDSLLSMYLTHYFVRKQGANARIFEFSLSENDVVDLVEKLSPKNLFLTHNNASSDLKSLVNHVSNKIPGKFFIYSDQGDDRPILEKENQVFIFSETQLMSQLMSHTGCSKT